ncbi:MAG TPA: hypothetical protein V6C58_17325, partial [Allocoleopsis sp.]
MNKQETFITKAKLVHKNKYDYSNVKYINNSTKVVIKCPKHGDFIQMPKHHISGRGCAACGRDICSEKFKCKLTQDQINYINNNINKISIKNIAKNINICKNTLSKYIKNNN